MNGSLNAIRNVFRVHIRRIARVLNRLSGGKLTPNMVTWFGFLMHVPIAFLIATEHNIWAVILLFVFGLFDTMDGELARLQNRESDAGGLLDAATDRMKEVLLYSGAAYILAASTHPKMAVWAIVACGASLCVSYVKAKGEATVARTKHHIPYTQLNKMFADGLVPFEIRMVILMVGLLSGKLGYALIVIAVLASYTAFQRLFKITRQLG
jgi:archaetidylinositol phosphate synthase